VNANYSEWSRQELRRAERVAGEFLEENADQILDTLRAKLKFLQVLVHRLDRPGASLDYRLDCFARIAELSNFMKDDANGLFELASNPIVAGLLSEVPRHEEQE
jgi:hypothetical protein